MGNNVSEGAIVQHLAKLRVRRVAANKDVPPPLRRGGTGAVPKSSASDAVAGPSTEVSDKSKSKSKKKDGDEESVSSAASDASSDEEYGKKRRSKKTKTKNKKVKRESKEVDLKSEPATDGESEGRDKQIALDDRGNELVAIGAQFLSYPNDKNLPSSPTSSESSDEVQKPTKVVTLRIRQGLEKFADHQSFSGVQGMETMVPSYPNVNRGSPGHSYQSAATVTPTSVQSHDDLFGFPGFDNALHSNRIQGNQIMGPATTMGPSFGYGDLPQTSPIQGHGHAITYQPPQSIALNPYAEFHHIDDNQMLEPPSMFNPAVLNSSNTNIIENPLFPDGHMNPYSGMMWPDSMEDPNMLS
ncbi:hypothetical protein VTN00DRAFT_3518 [Thermoascus crustaceus]|uniref:uncharacterized protein n=1 Tax=Thermoascus crustaceus TaxID=5088 RepID=UPI0037436963